MGLFPSLVIHFLYRLVFIQLHLEPPFFHAQDHRLPAHAPHHVERLVGRPVQRQRLDVFLDALFDDFAQFLLDLEEPVCRT
jgi:hypothetical protein